MKHHHLKYSRGMNQNEISGIVFSSRDGDIRDSLKSSLRTLSRLKSLKILDCGGGLNPWLLDLLFEKRHRPF